MVTKELSRVSRKDSDNGPILTPFPQMALGVIYILGPILGPSFTAKLDESGFGPIVGPGHTTKFDESGFRPEGDPGPIRKPGDRPYHDPEDEEDEEFNDDEWPEAASPISSARPVTRPRLAVGAWFGEPTIKEPILGGGIYPVAPGYKAMGAWFGESVIGVPGHVIILKTEKEIAAYPDTRTLSAAKWWRGDDWLDPDIPDKTGWPLGSKDPTPGLKGYNDDIPPVLPPFVGDGGVGFGGVEFGVGIGGGGSGYALHKERGDSARLSPISSQSFLNGPGV